MGEEQINIKIRIYEDFTPEERIRLMSYLKTYIGMAIDNLQGEREGTIFGVSLQAVDEEGNTIEYCPTCSQPIENNVGR